MIYWIILIIALLIFVLFEIFPIVFIEGNSMHPTLLSGEVYLGVRVFRKKKIRPLQVYVFRPPYDSDEQRYVVKRLFNIRRHPNGDVQYFFVGDNRPESYDSREYGFVSYKNVVARLTNIRLMKVKRGETNE